uniref:DNA-directed RNA polymerase subunit beta'' n=1 Tax=Stauridium tetras TaxID=271398 RepID=A0A2U8GJX9_9CHLO|nr:RNA polymerase beta subunit [Stauridium tetras]AWI68949.1 RNA polymerase beta subunit [Stauridium tetras]
MQKFRFLIKKKKLVNNSINQFSSIGQIERCFCIKNTNRSNIDFESFNIFWNCSFDKGRLKSFVSWFLNTYGENKTIELLEELKNLGFGYATKAGISLGIDDLKIPPQKFDLINKAQTKIFKGLEKYKKGQITGIERLQQLIDVWNQTSEFLKQEVIRYFETTDLFNPVYMMAFSGARGNISQVRQLVGMRGLMSDPQGNIIDFPIQSNFREGLTLTEYIISTYGARKGIVDTALRTATAGYLTRRLVDVAQHVMISQFDCGTTRGIFVFDMKEGAKTIYSFQNRLIGRVLADDISLNNAESNSLIPFKKAYRNQEISPSLASFISKITKKAFVRSPLTCETRKFVCQLCYGWSLASSRLVSIGEAVGVIAAQSIGEPGTQLTMRTFHTGGVFSGGLTNQIIAPYDGYIEYLDTIPGTCIRTPQGDIAFLTKTQGSFFIKENKQQKKNSFDISKLNSKTNSRYDFYTIPAYAILFARNNQQVFKKQIVAQFSSVAQQQTQRGNAEQTIYAELEGQVALFQIDLLEQKNEKLFDDILLKAMDWSKIWVLSGKIYYDPLGLNHFAVKGDFFNKNATFQKIYWRNLNDCFFDFHLKKRKSKQLSLNIIKRLSIEKKKISSLFGINHRKNDSVLFKKISKHFYMKGLKKQLLLFLNKKFIYFYYINFSSSSLHSEKRGSAIYDFRLRSKSKKSKEKNLVSKNYSKIKQISYKFSYFFLINNQWTHFNSLISKSSENRSENSSKIKKQKNFQKFSLKIKNIDLNNNQFYLKNSQNFSLKKTKFIGFNGDRKKNSLREFEFYLNSFSTVSKNPKKISKKIHNHWNQKLHKNSIDMKSKENLKKKNVVLNLVPQNFIHFEFCNKYLNNKIFLKKKSTNISAYIYPFRTNVLPFLFKKINRMNFLSYYLENNKKISLSKKNQKFFISDLNKRKQTNIKKIKNPFLFQRFIPNFIKKKKIQKRIFSMVPELENSFYDFYQFKKNFKKSLLLGENGKKIKLYNLKNHSLLPQKSKIFVAPLRKSKIFEVGRLSSKIVDFRSSEGAQSSIFEKEENQRFLKKNSNFKANFISFKKIDLTDFKSMNGKPSFIEKKKDFSLKGNPLINKKLPFKFLFVSNLFKRSYFHLNNKNIKKNGSFSLIKEHLNPKKNLSENFYKQKIILNLPVSKIYFKKLGYIFSINRNSKKEILSKLKTTNFSNDFHFTKKEKSDLILSFFPLTTFYNTPINSSTINDSGKNYQKLSLGNTLHLSPFSNIGFRWFPFESKTILNGIFIWSDHFLRNKTINEKEIKNNDKSKDNPDLSIKNYSFFQKKRWIYIDDLLKKYPKKQIFRSFNTKSLILKQNKNTNKKNFSIFLMLRETKNENSKMFSTIKKMTPPLKKNEKFAQKSSHLKFRYDLTLNQKLQIFVTKKDSKKLLSFNESNIKDIEDFSEIHSSFFNIRTKFSKFSVYTQDFYYIPQENFRLNFLQNSKNDFETNISSSKIYLSNRQGLKKVLPSQTSGFIRIYKKNRNESSQIKLKNDPFKTLRIHNKQKKQFQISCFHNKIYKKDLNNKLSIDFFHLKKSLKTKEKKKFLNQILFKKEDANLIFYKKIKKASYNMNLKIRNKMILNLLYKFFRKKTNTKSKKNKNLKLSKFYKSYDLNQNLNLITRKQKRDFIAVLKNQSLFFSNIPFHFLNGYKSSNSYKSKKMNLIEKSNLSNQKKEILNESFKRTKNFNNINQKQKVETKSTLFCETSIFETIKKPGWIYFLINDFSFSQKSKIKNFMYLKNLHQTFVNTGKTIIHDVSFEQNKIFIENVFLKKKLKNKILKINQIYTNNNCRFFDGHQSSMIFSQNNEFCLNTENLKSFKNNQMQKNEFNEFIEKSEIFNNLALLLRPIHHKILPNPQYYKKEISANQKNFYNNYSILFYKDFHSNFLNLQNCNTKSLSKFPSLDFQIFQVPNNTKQFKNQMSKNGINSTKKPKTKLQGNSINSKFLNKLKNPKNVPFNSFSLNNDSQSKISKQNYRKLKKQSYDRFVSFYLIKNPSSNRFFNIFYSAYKIHSFSFELKHTKPLGFNFGFNIPTFYFKKLCSNFRKENSYNLLKSKNLFYKKKENLSDFFYCLIKKNSLKKNWISIISKKYPIAYSHDFASKIVKKNKTKIFQADFRSFFSFVFLYPFPFIEWSLSRKDDYFVNNLFSSALQKSKQCDFPNSLNSNLWNSQSVNDKMKLQNLSISISNSKKSGILNKESLNMQPFSFAFPRLKNAFRLYKASNKIIANQVYASTDLLSPFEGELLIQNNMKAWWSKYSETILKHKKSNIKNSIFLTKKDLFSISIQNKFLKQNGIIERNDHSYKSSSLYLKYDNLFNKNIKQKNQANLFNKIKKFTINPFIVEYHSSNKKKEKNYNISNFVTKYQNKLYKLKGLSIGKESNNKIFHFYLGKFLLKGNNVFSYQRIDQTGQIIHLNSKKITLRYAQPFLVSPKGILHVQQGDYIYRNAPIITLPFETLTTGDIVQGIPKVEQFLEARTTQNGRFFLYSLPILQKAIFERYRSKLPLEQAVAQSFLKIQQIIVDGVQRVYRSQGVSIAEKHLEVIVKQMTSKVQILHGGQTGFFPGEFVDLEIVENVNKFLMVKIRYEPIVLGITRASLEVDSFLSAASFQQTTKILAKASLSKKKDYLKGLKENILVGNLIPAGTGFMNSY